MSTIVKLNEPIFELQGPRTPRPLRPDDHPLIAAALRAGKVEYISTDARRQAPDFFMQSRM